MDQTERFPPGLRPRASGVIPAFGGPGPALPSADREAEAGTRTLSSLCGAPCWPNQRGLGHIRLEGHKGHGVGGVGEGTGCKQGWSSTPGAAARGCDRTGTG